MTTKVVPGQLVAAITAEDVAKEAAARIAKALRGGIERYGSASIALSGGNTPRAAYALLAKDASVDWTKVEVFWVDERAVAPTDDRSNYRWAKATLLDGANIPAHAVWRMPADARDLARAAKAYDALLHARVRESSDGWPAFDALVLGVGDDGHTASLFPGDPAIDIADRGVVAVDENKGVREARMTLTAPVIERAVALFVLAVGAGKQTPLERAWAVEGDIHATPARIIRGGRGAITWVIDRAAGGVE
jgi:6-phosphogluconolactonase